MYPDDQQGHHLDGPHDEMAARGREEGNNAPRNAPAKANRSVKLSLVGAPTSSNHRAGGPIVAGSGRRRTPRHGRLQSGARKHPGESRFAGVATAEDEHSSRLSRQLRNRIAMRLVDVFHRVPK